VHEWALAEVVVETVKRRALENNIKNFSVLKIKLGMLQQIDKDVLLFALEELLKLAREEHGVSVEHIVIDEEKPVAECTRCGYRWEIDLQSMDEEYREYIHFLPETIHIYVSCPRCRSKDFEIVSGRGLYVELY
jgi:hydrogenase nickel incorporation protein HypA/HybF